MDAIRSIQGNAAESQERLQALAVFQPVRGNA